MTLKINPFTLKGKLNAPPSKSMAHRYLICAALSGEKCSISGVDFSEDILATIDCLKALGAEINIENDTVTINSKGFMKAEKPVLFCRESGSTLRFFIPLALCMGRRVSFSGSRRLFERPLGVYEKLCREKGFLFEVKDDSVILEGRIEKGVFEVDGSVSSQFISGLLFALAYLGGDSEIRIIPPFESRSYVNLTLCALKAFGADAEFTGEYTIKIKNSVMHSFTGKIEGDYSNGAFLDAFNYIGSDVEVGNLKTESLQGDRIYKKYFEQLSKGAPTLDISDCPDLGPVLIALAALKNGAVLTGTDRLKAKESDRGAAMGEELKKLGGGLVFGENMITVPKRSLSFRGEAIDGHNDHRIVMAMALILSRTGGIITGAEAVKKSYPGFFENIISAGANIIAEEN